MKITAKNMNLRNLTTCMQITNANPATIQEIDLSFNNLE